MKNGPQRGLKNRDTNRWTAKKVFDQMRRLEVSVP